VAAGTTREQLRAWYEQVRAASRSRGDTSVMLLYSESEHLASVVSFGEVPWAERNIRTLPPISNHEPLLPPHAGTLDWSAWVISIFFQFEPGDRGRPSLWPMPDIEPYRGDGVCEVSRHESSRNTTDCLATCGNGVPDADETPFNCPGDVPLP